MSINPTFEQVGYRLVEATINFLGKPFKDGSPILDHLKVPTLTNIHSYFDVEKLKQFNFYENGFEYRELEEDSPLLGAIDRYAQAHLINQFPIEEESQLALEIEQYLSTWGKQKGISGSPVVVNNVYRNSDRARGGLSPFSFVHTDFYKEAIANPFLSEGEMYKSGAESKFGPLSNIEYKNIKHNAQVNVWIPLHTEESNNTLAVLDISSVKDIEQKRNYSGPACGAT